MIGTSINGPTVAANACGLCVENNEIEMAMANSKLLLAAVNANVID